MDIAGFHQYLHRWYQTHGRHHLPWRQTSDPYHIWLSEVMLQQTQVQTVLERYYYPFLERFPTHKALAQANLQGVLKAWEGLGYYSRARNLHRAAQMTGEALPDTVDELMQLPGIGRNTAHAIAAFAFRQPLPVLEANVKRVVARIFALETVTDKKLWSKAEQLVDPQNPFDYNQAMMDIGSQLCTPAQPQCLLCPANTICQGQADPTAYPQKKPKKPLPVRQKAIVLFTLPDGRIYITPRENRFLHGLWAFPEVEANQAHLNFLGIDYPFTTMEVLGNIEHAYTHFLLKADIYQSELNLKINDSQYWKTPKEITELPLSRTEKKILKLLVSVSPATQQENRLLRK